MKLEAKSWSLTCQRLAAFATLALVIAFASSGCDSYEPPTKAQQGKSAVFQGNSHHASGTAKLAMGSSGLTVADLSEGGVDVEIAGSRQGDFYFRVDSIPGGGAFTAKLMGSSEKAPIASVTQRGLETGDVRLLAEVRRLGTPSVAIEYYHGGELVHRQVQVASTDNKINALPLGTANRAADSYHFEIIELDDGTTIKKIVKDYESGEAALIQPPIEGVAPVRATHVAVLPQGTVADVPPVDRVRFEGRGVGRLSLLGEHLR